MKSIPLHVQILVAMALGAAVGLTLNTAGSQGWIDREQVLFLAAFGEKAGQLFLAALNMVVIPLIFGSVVSALTGLTGQGAGLRRLGIRTVAYYIATSGVAILVGVALVNLIRPGDGVSYELLMEAARGEMATQGRAVPTGLEAVPDGALAAVGDLVFRMVPPNIVAAASTNTATLSVIFFAVLFGVAALRTGGEALETVDRVARAVFDVMLTLTHGILLVAPIGIFGYVAFVTATTGLALAGALGWYMFTVFIGLVIHGAVILPLVLRLLGGTDPLRFALPMKEALLTAFSTASSNASLPLTLKCAQEAGIPPRVANFTLPLGGTINMDGTALYEAVAVLFISQMIGDLTIGQQVVMAFTALLASVGAAGIPHAGTVMMVIVLGAVGLPTDAVLVILAVDRVLDMCRTTVNVWSDMVGAAVIAHHEPPLAEGEAA